MRSSPRLGRSSSRLTFFTSPIIPQSLTGDGVSTVEFQVELQDIHSGLTEKSQVATTSVLRQHRADLIRADVAGLGPPGDRDVGVGRRDVRVQAAAAGGHGVGRYLWVGRGGAANGHRLPARVVLAELGAVNPNAFVEVQER